VRIPTGAAVHHIDWIVQQLPRGGSLAVDGNVLGIAAAQALHAGVDKAGISLRTDIDVFDTAWPERPGLPDAPVYEGDVRYVRALTCRRDGRSGFVQPLLGDGPVRSRSGADRSGLGR